jgi:HNH endonuclease
MLPENTISPSKKRDYTCPICGTIFARFPSQPHSYCSRVCNGKAQAKRGHLKRTVKAPPRFNACQHCGKDFVFDSRAPATRFCSSRCFGDWRHEQWVKQHPPRLCEHCGAEMPRVARRGDARFCSHRCSEAFFSGERSPLWKGGERKYYGPSWRAARRAVRLRDRVCRRCGKTPQENGAALEVHHLIAFREFGVERHGEANDPSNLIALCLVCHRKIEGTRRRAAA